MKQLSPQVPLGRLPYFLAGVVLLGLKMALDLLIARSQGHPYSILFYFDPTTAPLLRPTELGKYWLYLAYETVPFAIVGVILTLRRLRDAAVSPWLALFFFVPFANLLFFAATALLPPHHGETRTPGQVGPFRDRPVVVEPRRSRGVGIVYAAALGTVAALGGFAVSVGLLHGYGLGLAFGTPMISGFVAGAFTARLVPDAKPRDALLSALMTFALAFAVLFVFALEGVGCLVLFLPILFAPAVAGTLLGFHLGRSIPPRHLPAATGGALMLLGLTFGAEALVPEAPHAAEVVVTDVVIDAPPERVWPVMVRVAEMPPPTEWPFSMGIAYPVRATLDAEAVSATRRCFFDTGVALETVTVWEPNRRLRFTIDAQPDLLRELTLYRTVRQPHLDGHVRNREGELELVPLDGGRRTRLVGRSWYETRLHPTAYWELYAERIVHAVHRRVLGAVKERAERGPAIAER